jgi:hypothetical protein
LTLSRFAFVKDGTWCNVPVPSSGSEGCGLTKPRRYQLGRFHVCFDRSPPEKHPKVPCGFEVKHRRIFELSTDSTPELYTATAWELPNTSTEASPPPQELPSPVPMAFRGFRCDLESVELEGDNSFHRIVYTNYEKPQHATARHGISNDWMYPAHNPTLYPPSPLSLAATSQFRPQLRILEQPWTLPDMSSAGHSQASSQTSPATPTSNDSRNVTTPQQTNVSPINNKTSPHGLCSLSRGQYPPTCHAPCESQWRVPNAATSIMIEATTSYTSRTADGLYDMANDYSCYPLRSSASTEPPPSYSTASHETLHATTQAEDFASSWSGLENSNIEDGTLNDEYWWFRNQSRGTHTSDPSVEHLPSEARDQSHMLQGFIESTERDQEYARTHDQQFYDIARDSHNSSNINDTGPWIDELCKLCVAKFTGK